MGTLNRYILRGLVVNYLIAISVMVSLYIVLDLFFNMDEFTENRVGVTQILFDVFGFYGNRIFLYFAQLSGVITLFSCLTTLARMRRMNELTAVLASGVSLYRVAVPVMAFAVFTTGLWYVDTEIVIPSIAHKLARRHDDARGLKTYRLSFLRDGKGSLLNAQQYLPTEAVLKRLLIVKRGPTGAIESVIEAEEAHWEPVSGDSPTGAGRWRLERGIERRRIVQQADTLAPQGDIEQTLVSYYETNLNPRTIEMRQSTGWFRFLSSRRLTELSEQFEGPLRQKVMQAKYNRFTAPLISLLLLWLGLPFILSRIPGNILADGSRCLLVCGACFLFTFMAQNLGDSWSFPALPAWLPIIVFTPVAAVLTDRMRT